MFKLAITVARLPKTRSGKILRGTMPATIDDPAILHESGRFSRRPHQRWGPDKFGSRSARKTLLYRLAIH